MTQTATKVQKQVHLIAKATFKKSGFILYRVQRDGSLPHDVTVFGGRVTSCVVAGETCKAFQYNHKCSHSQFVEAKEQERIALEQRIDVDMVQHVQDDLSVKGTLNNSNKGFSLLR